MIDKISKGVILNLIVVPNSAKFEMTGFEVPNNLRVKVCSPAQKNKANKEILKKLGKFFNAKIEIIKGKKSNRKIVLVQAEEKKVLKKLAQS